MLNLITSVLLYITILTLQFIIPKYFSFGLFFPNFILMYVVYTALNRGPMRGQLTGFFYGLSWDILSTDIFGIRALTLTIAGHIAGRFNRNLNKDQIVTQIIIMFICLVITHISLVLLYLLIPGDFAKQSPELNSHFVIYYAVNLLATPIFFKFIPLVGKILKTGKKQF